MAVMHDSDAVEPEARHRACWYGRRTSQVPAVPTVQTIEDGQLLFCAHPMMFPIVGHDFDIRNCIGCDAYRPGRSQSAGTAVRIPASNGSGSEPLRE